MIPACSRVWASVMVVAKLFQLFHPIGGVGASNLPSDGAALAVEAVAKTVEAPSRARRFKSMIAPALFANGLVVVARQALGLGDALVLDGRF
jgi:hypothetical protein